MPTTAGRTPGPRALGPATRSRLALLGVVAGAVSLVNDNNYLAADLHRSRLGDVRTFISELSARDQPGSGWYRLSDTANGLALVVLGVVLLLVLGRGRAWPALVGFAGVAMTGVAGVLDALWPLDCVATLDPRCAALEAAGRLSRDHYLHSWSSSLGVVFLLVSMGGLALGTRLDGRDAALGVAALVALVLNAAATAVVAPFSLAPYSADVGLAQRVQVTLGSLWIAWLAVDLLRRGALGRGRERPAGAARVAAAAGPGPAR